MQDQTSLSTREEELKLFNDVSKAITKGDSSEIAALTKEPPAEVQKVEAKEPEKKEEKVVEAKVEDSTSTSQSTATTTTSTSETKTTDTPKAKEAEENWVEKLPEEFRGKVTDLLNKLDKTKDSEKFFKQRYKSDVGRVSAYQRSISKLESQLEELSKRPLAQQVAQAADKSKDTDLEALAQNDPNFAAFIKAREQKLRNEMAEAFDKRLQEHVAPLVQSRNEDYVIGQRELLKEMVPNVEEVCASEPFDYWMKNVASSEELTLIRSPHAQVGVKGLKLYADWLHTSGLLEPQQQQVASSTQATKSPSASTAEADKIAQAREAKSVSAAAVTTSTRASPAVGTGKNDVVDPQALFEEFYKKHLPDQSALKRR